MVYKLYIDLGTTVLLKKGAHIGHGAVIHGGTIGENTLVGMNAADMPSCLEGGDFGTNPWTNHSVKVRLLLLQQQKRLI